MISTRLLELVRCPDCRSRLLPEQGELVCERCGHRFRRVGDAYVDLRPSERFAEQTKYLDEALHADARHERVSPPLLGSKIRNDMLRGFLGVQPSDVVIDLGCGSGRTLLWNRDWEATAVGVDISPFFSQDACRDVDLLIGDLRRLPFGASTFTKAFSLDVLEHLSPEALAGMLAEASRVLEPGGALFVYTHVRKNAPIAAGLRWINALARRLERVGLIDLRQERLRKSDHLNPLADIPDLERTVAAAGFRIARIRYYTPIVGGLIENIFVRMAERQMARGAARRQPRASVSGRRPSDDHDGIREARAAAKERIATSRATYAALRVLSALMKLDVLLFGRIQSGPFFALLVKDAAATGRG